VTSTAGKIAASRPRTKAEARAAPDQLDARAVDPLLGEHLLRGGEQRLARASAHAGAPITVD
jgi:hypothetical protein